MSLAYRGSRAFLFFELREIGVRGGVDDVEVFRLRYQVLQVFQVLSGGAAAVVSDAPEQNAELLTWMGPHPFLDLRPGCSAPRIVVRLEPRRQDLGAVEADPDESLRRELGELTIGPAEKVGRITALGQDLDEASGMAERVKVGGCFDIDAEFLPEISLSQNDLADKGLSAGHVAVRLEEPAAQDVPLSLLDQALDFLEEGGLIFLDPLVEDGFVVTEDKFVEGFAEGGRRPEGR